MMSQLLLIKAKVKFTDHTVIPSVYVTTFIDRQDTEEMMHISCSLPCCLLCLIFATTVVIGMPIIMIAISCRLSYNYIIYNCCFADLVNGEVQDSEGWYLDPSLLNQLILMNGFWSQVHVWSSKHLATMLLQMPHVMP